MIKKIFNFSSSFFLLLLLSPLIFTIIVLIFLFDGRPIFFIQQRAGLSGSLFNLYKFRTMDTNAKKDDTLRMTNLGRFLREIKLDEIPQLVNILKGELAFVGPRPLFKEYNIFYNKTQKIRLSILPGLTGWSQIHEKENTTWSQRISLDVWYVRNRSFKLDFYIIIKTLILILTFIFLKRKRIALITKRFDER